LATGNPFLIAAAAAAGAAAGDVAADYLTTDENEEFEVDKLSAAFSAITGGLAGADYANPEAFKEIGTTGIRGGDAITQGQYDSIMVAGDAGQNAIDLGRGTADSLQAVQNAKDIEAAFGAAQLGESLTLGESVAGIGRDIVGGAQAYVDPFGSGQGTISDVLGSGGNIAQVAAAGAKALVPGTAEYLTNLGVEAVEAAKAAEQAFEDYKTRLGISREQTLSDARRLRRQYYIQSFKNFGYSDAEIADVLFRSGLIDTVEDYDPTDLPQDRQFGEDVTNDTLYAARGGRVGFDEGGLGGYEPTYTVGQYVEEQKIREEMMDKMKRGLGAKEMNMKLNDPGLFGRIRNVLNPMDNEMGFYTNEETSFPDTKRRYQNMIRNMDQDRAAADYEMRDKMTLVEDYMNRLNTMEMGMATGGIPRVRNSMGTRTTSEGDPISPDMPDGMQMDLRGGGFIPLGTKPKADDIPAMVGKNEFVLNDEAVSGIGKMLTGRPDPRAGARALYKLQNEMEAIV